MPPLSSHIDDGFTQPGYFKAEPRMHGELRFKFRPCLGPERRAYWDWEERHDRDPKAKPADKTAKQAEIFKLHIFDAGDVAKLHPNLYDRLFNVALGVSPPDEDPLAPPEPAGDDSKN